MNNNRVEVTNSVSTYRTKGDITHELTMLYLKNQDISNLSVSELAQKYTDISKELSNEFKEQRKHNTMI